MSQMNLKRVYDPPSEEDGTRVLVDRLWPRGLKKDEAKVDLWLKDLAPSTELRHWFSHDPNRWAEFERRYRRELKANAEALAPLQDLLRSQKPLTLLFGAKDLERNNALVLRDFITSA